MSSAAGDLAKAIVASVRPWMEGSLHQGLSEHRSAEDKAQILDTFFKCFRDHVARDPLLYSPDFLQSTLVIRKQNLGWKCWWHPIDHNIPHPYRHQHNHRKCICQSINHPEVKPMHQVKVNKFATSFWLLQNWVSLSFSPKSKSSLHKKHLVTGQFKLQLHFPILVSCNKFKLNF